jgi:hypothetical protein
MRTILITALVLMLSACASLTREPDKGVSDGPRIMGIRTTYHMSSTAHFNAGCSGRPLSTPGQRRRCGLQPF